MARHDEVATAFVIMLEVIEEAIVTLNQDGAEVPSSMNVLASPPRHIAIRA